MIGAWAWDALCRTMIGHGHVAWAWGTAMGIAMGKGAWAQRWVPPMPALGALCWQGMGTWHGTGQEWR